MRYNATVSARHLTHLLTGSAPCRGYSFSAWTYPGAERTGKELYSWCYGGCHELRRVSNSTHAQYLTSLSSSNSPLSLVHRLASRRFSPEVIPYVPHRFPMATISPTPIVIDGKGHLLGRLASIISKQILNGQKIVVVRCEEINISGSFFRNKVCCIRLNLLRDCSYSSMLPKLRYHNFLHKRHIVNPKKSGPFHHRAPSKILFRAIRGMVPHKTARGAAALERLKLYEGVPPLYDRKKRMVVPEALRVLRLKPGRKYCTVKVSNELTQCYDISSGLSVSPTKSDGVIRMLLTASRRRERSGQRPSMNAK